MSDGHDRFRDLLSPFLEGDLPDRDADAVRAHLEACDSCRAELALLRRTIAALRRLPEFPAPASILAGVRASIAPRPWHRRALEAFRGGSLRMAVPSAAVATLVLVIGIALFQRHPMRRAPVALAPAGAPARAPGRESVPPAPAPVASLAPGIGAPAGPPGPREREVPAGRGDGIPKAAGTPAEPLPPVAASGYPAAAEGAGPVEVARLADRPGSPPAKPAPGPETEPAADGAPAVARDSLSLRAGETAPRAVAETAPPAPAGPEAPSSSQRVETALRKLTRRPEEVARGTPERGELRRLPLEGAPRSFPGGERVATLPELPRASDAPSPPLPEAKVAARAVSPTRRGPPATAPDDPRAVEALEVLYVLSEDGDELEALRSLIDRAGGNVLEARALDEVAGTELVRPVRNRFPFGRSVRQAWEIQARLPRGNLEPFLDAVRRRPGYQLLERQEATLPPPGPDATQELQINLFR